MRRKCNGPSTQAESAWKETWETWEVEWESVEAVFLKYEGSQCTEMGSWEKWENWEWMWERMSGFYALAAAVCVEMACTRCVFLAGHTAFMFYDAYVLCKYPASCVECHDRSYPRKVPYTSVV